MSRTASQITSLTIVCATVYSGTDQIKYQSPASLAFVRGIHRWRGKRFHFMTSSCSGKLQFILPAWDHFAIWRTSRNTILFCRRKFLVFCVKLRDKIAVYIPDQLFFYWFWLIQIAHISFLYRLCFYHVFIVLFLSYRFMPNSSIRHN